MWQFFLAGMVLGLIILVVVLVRERRRDAAMAEYAHRRGWRFQKKDTIVATLAILKKGGTAKRVMRGRQGGREWIICDYTFSTGYGKNRQSHTQTLFIAQTETPIPKFCCSPENWGKRLGDFFQKKDIDFTEDKAFSQRYHLVGDDSVAIRKLLHGSLRALLLQQHGWTVEASSKHVGLFKADKRIPADEFQVTLSQLGGIVRSLERATQREA